MTVFLINNLPIQGAQAKHRLTWVWGAPEHGASRVNSFDLLNVHKICKEPQEMSLSGSPLKSIAINFVWYLMFIK